MRSAVGQSQKVWRVTAGEVSALVEVMLNPTRLHSLVVVSPASDTGQPRLDVDALVSSVEDLPCDVVVLDSMAASERLSDSISEAFHCYGGSVRVVMPRARVTDHFRRHPLLLIYPTDDRTLSLRRVVEAAERTPLSLAEPPEGSRPPVRLAMPSPDQPRPAPKPGPPASRPTPAALPTAAAGTGAADLVEPPDRDAVVDEVGSPTPPPMHTPFGLADVEAVVVRAMTRTLEEQLGGPSSETQRERSRADTAEELLAEAERRIGRLEAQLAERGPSLVLPVVYDDPEAQLRWEVETRWLMSMPEQQRRAFTLPPWTAGPGFLAGLEHPVVPRRKTIAVMLAVLRGRVWDEYTTHQFLESKAGKPRLSPTGTAVWRTYVKAETPQAPRLTWWQNPDTSCHFEHVGTHDELI